MPIKVTGAPNSGKIKTHIEVKAKVNAETGKPDGAVVVVVETPVEPKEEDEK
jgi:hypothetical protein